MQDTGGTTVLLVDMQGQRVGRAGRRGARLATYPDVVRVGSSGSSSPSSARLIRRNLTAPVVDMAEWTKRAINRLSNFEPHTIRSSEVS